MIITDSIKNVNRIFRKTNDSGTMTYGDEAITAAGLAWQIVIEDRSHTGISSVRMINNNTAAAFVLDLMINDPVSLSFVPSESICLATAAEILKNMNLMRCNAYEPTVTDQKVKELESFIDKYENTLKAQELFDEPLVLKEAISLIKAGRVALEPGNVRVCYYHKPSMLETEFVSLLSKASGMAEPDEFNKPTSKKASYSFVKTYGIVNEADYVAKTIIDKELPLGDVELICDTNVYAPFIQEAFAKRGIDYSFTTGVSGAGFNLVQLYKNLILWYASRCNYEELFRVMHNPLFALTIDGTEQRASYPYLKGISYGIGWDSSRYLHAEQSAYDRAAGVKENDICRQFREKELRILGELAMALDKADTAVEVLDLLMAYVKTHTRKRNQENQYTTKAMQLLRKSMAVINLNFSDKKDLLEYVINCLDGISYSESETGSAVSISNIYAPLCLERKHIFIIGLSAKEFKISCAESPVLGDDLRRSLFGDPPRGNVTLAENALDNAENVIRQTLNSADEGAEITVISSAADVMRDGSDVSTSSLFEKLLEENTKGSTKPEESYRYHEITNYDIKIDHDKHWNGYDISWPEVTGTVECRFSKSSLDDFLKCPLMYHYERDLGIDAEEHKNYDPGVWLEANTRGSLIHSILENYANNALKDNTAVDPNFDSNSSEFVDAVDTAVKEAEKLYAYPSKEVKDKELDECIELVKTYLTELHKDLHDNHWVVMACEEKIDPKISKFGFDVSGIPFEISFTGSIDRIDYRDNEDGTRCYRIADYKTGKYNSASDMKKSTKQHLIYAFYVSNKYHAEVETFDYIYLKALYNGTEWVSSIGSAELTKDIISPVPGKSGISEQDMFGKVLVDHAYEDIKCLVKSCSYCRYKDICLFNMQPSKS